MMDWDEGLVFGEKELWSRERWGMICRIDGTTNHF